MGETVAVGLRCVLFVCLFFFRWGASFFSFWWGGGGWVCGIRGVLGEEVIWGWEVDVDVDASVAEGVAEGASLRMCMSGC